MYLKSILTFYMKDNSDEEDADAEVNSDTDSSVSLSDEEELKKVKAGKQDFH